MDNPIAIDSSGNLPKLFADPIVGEKLGQEIQQSSQNREQGRKSNSPILRVIFLLALLVVVVGVVNIAGKRGENFLRPSTVSAAEIIRRNLEKFIKPNTIYHQKTKQYLGGSDEPNTYEIWEDQESERFYNEATYSDGRKTVQGFNLEFRWDIDYQTKTIHKDIYVYNNQSGLQPVGRRVDIAEQFDELIRNGILETKEGKLDGREVYVIYDTRASPEKYWDILTFDKNNFQILQTEKYGADRKLEELVTYETQEAIERTEESLAKFFTYKDPGNDFTLYQRKFYTSTPYQEDYFLVSGPQTTPVSTITGTVKTGAQLGEVKSYCSNGLYLVADEGTYLVNQAQMLQLRLPDQPDGTKMLSDQKYVGKRVEVVGKYPAQENFCEALICECEDYILVDHINIVDTQSVEKRQTKIEGQIDCLPHRDTTGGQTLECAFGLRGKDGMYYGLQGLNQQDLISGKIASGQKVVITGIFTPSQDSKYNTIGTVEVVSVEYTN